MTDYDDSSDVEFERIQAAGDAELDGSLEETFAPPLPGEGHVADNLHGEALASWNLRRIRQVLGFSQQQVSEKIAESNSVVRLSQSQIAKIERGERPWRVDEMLAIAAALGITFLEFFGGPKDGDDPTMNLLAARLAYQVAGEAEQVAREEWRAKVRAERDAGEAVVRVAARMGVQDATAMQILVNRWTHQTYVQQFLEEQANGWNPSGADMVARAEAANEWAENEWQRYLRNEKG